MRFVVLSLNTWGLPFGLARNLPRRTEALAASLAGRSADVIALQEVWTARARERLRSAAAEAGFGHAFFVDHTHANAGLLVLSKWPFVRGHASHFRVRGRAERVQHGDFWSGKGWLDLVVATPVGDIRLVDTHLHAAYTHSGQPDEYAGERMAQAVELAHGLRDRTQPIIAVGDFNMRDDSEEYAVWRSLSGTSDAATRLGERWPTVLAHSPYSKPGARDERIDYAFVRDGQTLGARPITLQRAFDESFEIGGQAARYSDHAGLRLEVELQPTPGSEGAATVHAQRRRELIALARTRLEETAERTQARARHQTTAGFAGLVAVGAAGMAADLATRERRAVLRALALAPAALGLVASGVTVALGQAFTRSAARQLYEVAALLDDFDPDSDLDADPDRPR